MVSPTKDGCASRGRPLRMAGAKNRYRARIVKRSFLYKMISAYPQSESETGADSPANGMASKPVPFIRADVFVRFSESMSRSQGKTYEFRTRAIKMDRLRFLF